MVQVILRRSVAGCRELATAYCVPSASPLLGYRRSRYPCTNPVICLKLVSKQELRIIANNSISH